MGTWQGTELDQLIIRGERLTHRRWRHTDAEAVRVIMADQRMHDFLPLPNPYTQEDAEQFVAGFGHEGRGEGTGIGGALEDSAGQLVGAAALRLPAPRHASAEVGYWIAADAQRHGYATEATRLLTDWAFEHGVGRVQIRCAVANVASALVAMKAGFRFEGTLRGEVVTPYGTADGASFGRLADDPGTPVSPALPWLPDAGLSDGVVSLRVTTRADAEFVRAEHDNPESRRWAMAPVPTLSTLEAQADAARLEWLVGRPARMVMLDVASGQVAGTIQLRPLGPRGTAGVGYGVLPQFRGRGFTVRSLRLLSAWAFEHAGIVRIELGAMIENVASQKVARAAGFEPDGIARAALPDESGVHHDEARFALVHPRFRE